HPQTRPGGPMSPAWGRAPHSHRDDDIDLEPDELGGDLGEAFAASLRPAILDRDVAAFDPAEFVQPLHKGGDRLADHRRRGPAKEPDSWQLRRLPRARRERPRGRRAAEQRDKLATLDLCAHSITSSAIASSDGGTVRPSVFAVLRLMTSSNFVGCITGRSAGLAPLRIRPTYMPTWRYASVNLVA